MLMKNMTMEEFEKKIKAGAPIILPVGALEAHGPHLPLGTDIIQPEYVAEKLAERINGIVAPPINYGVCTSLKNFPGTVSVGFDTLRNLVRDVLESFAAQGAKKIMVISGHAGKSHMIALKEAAYAVAKRHSVHIFVLSDYDIAYKYRGKLVPENDGHAGTIETARMLAILGTLGRKLPGPNYPRYPEFEVVPDFEKYFPECYRGDPSQATDELGKKINDIIIEYLAAMVAERWNH